MADDACTEWMGRRADGAHEARIGGRAEEAWTGPRRRKRGPVGTDKRTGERAD